MFKQSVLVGLCFLLTSCEEQTGQTGQARGGTTVIGAKTANRQDPTPGSAGTPNGKANPEAHNKDIGDLGPSLVQFIPEGYTALDTTSGDLNLDQYPDMILVLKKNGEDTSSNVSEHPEKRPLLILLGQAGNTFQLAARNDNTVYCIDCGGMMGDPFMDVVIKKGYFSVEHYGGSGWRWTRTITFKYSPAEKYWYLHKDGGDSFHATDPEKVTSKVRTTKDFGKVPFDKFDIYQES